MIILCDYKKLNQKIKKCSINYVLKTKKIEVDYV